MHVARERERQKDTSTQTIHGEQRKPSHRENKWLSNQFDMETNRSSCDDLNWFWINYIAKRWDTFDVQGNGLSWFMTQWRAVAFLVGIVKLGGTGAHTSGINKIHLFKWKQLYIGWWLGQWQHHQPAMSSFCLMTSFIQRIVCRRKWIFHYRIEFEVV